MGDKGKHNLHPAEPRLIAGLYNDSVNIYYHQTGAIVTTSQVSQVPVPPQELFIPWLDDFQFREFNYIPQDKAVSFEAHPDNVRCLAVCPALPILRFPSPSTAATT